MSRKSHSLRIGMLGTDYNRCQVRVVGHQNDALPKCMSRGCPAIAHDGAFNLLM